MLTETFKTILILSIAGGLITMLLFLLRPLTQKFFNQTWRYRMCILALLFFLLPVGMSGNSLYTALPDQSTPPDESQAVSALPDTVATLPVTDSAVNNTAALSITPSPETDKDTGIFLSDVLPLLPYIWLIGMVLSICINGFRYVRFRRKLIRTSLPVEDETIYSLLEAEKNAQGVSGKIRLLTSDTVKTPMLTGIFRTLLILPEVEANERELSTIFRHELIHYQRRDLWIKTATLLIEAVHWFNPAVYLLSREIEASCELSCDEQVVRDMPMEDRRFYGETILNMLGRVAEKHAGVYATLAETKKGVERRLTLMLSFKKMSKKTAVFSVAAAMLCVLAGFIGAASVTALAADTDITEDGMPEYTVEVYNDTTMINLMNEPFIQDGELYLPLRETLNAFGIDDIQYNNGEIQIAAPVPEIDNRIQALKESSTNVFQFTIGSPKLKSPDRALRTAPMLKNGTTYVPLDFFDLLILNGQIPRFRVNLIQPTDPGAYYSEGEEVFIGTGTQQDNYNPVDENSNRKLVKRIITNENGEVTAIVTVENQTPEVLSKLWNTGASMSVSMGYVMPDFESILKGATGCMNAYGEAVEFPDGVFVQKDGKFIAYIPPAYQINRSTPYSISYSILDVLDATPAPSAAATETDRTPQKAEVPAEPVSEDALPEYWAMGALNVEGVPYLPLVKTAENLGYTVNVSSFKIADKVPDWNPQYPDAVEYNYELLKDGKSLGIASLDISDGKVVQYMIDGIYCNTHDQETHTNIVLQDDTVYMPAQFFKEALDMENILP